jgi:hypothetical protein
VRSYIPEKKQKGQRNWAGKQAEQQAVYANRRRVRGEYGKSLLRRRGELVERSFAHCYDRRDAALPSAGPGKHSEAAVSPCRRVQSQSDLAQTARSGHAAGVEEPLRQVCFDPFLTLQASDQSEAALRQPNLCVPCPVLTEVAYPDYVARLAENSLLAPRAANVPQTLGGGRPVQVRLCVKSPELNALLGGSTTSDGQAIASDPVYLYYRTSDYLLISKDQNSDQPLIQMSMDEIRAVVWLQSRSESHSW